MASQMDKQDVLERAVRWMWVRGWKQKLAKSSTGQSLFEHTLIELDVLLELLDIAAGPKHYGLSETEQQILAAAVIVHDLGKESDAWQAYIGRPSQEAWVSHVIPEQIRTVVPEVCSALGFDGLGPEVQLTMAHCAELHHARPGRSDGAILEGMLLGGSDRLMTLAELVKALDHFCSAASAADAVRSAQNEPSLSKFLSFTTHQVLVRGVSSVFVHRAAERLFRHQGWLPLLYFPDATAYGADLNTVAAQPTAKEIQIQLKSEIDAALRRDVRSLMVGSPTGNILPKPDLFSFSESEDYLRQAAEKISPLSFNKKRLEAKRKVVESYWKVKGLTATPTNDQVEQDAARISDAQPEMLVFKFFKAMMDPNRMPEVGEAGARVAQGLYDEAFGENAWQDLQSTSTLMPAKDMAKTVDRFWALQGSTFGGDAAVAELDREARLGVLVRELGKIASKVYEGRTSPREGLSGRMSEAFCGDLLKPSPGIDVRELARKQLDHYCKSKPFAGKESDRGVYLCPICASPFGQDGGKKASADFIDNPQTHTNRGISHGPFGYIMVCVACYYERLLGQVLMGSRPAEVICLFPRQNIGPARGSLFVRGVRDWMEKARAQMRGETGDLGWGFSMGLTDWTARQLGDRDPFGIQADELPSLFQFRFSADTQRKRQREALSRLKEEFDGDLDALGAACGAKFDSWEGAVEALINDRLTQHEFKAIRREVFRLYETAHLICETPNVIFIPLSHEVATGTEESDTSKALRRLYVSLLLSLVFDAAVAIHKDGEPLQLRSGGAAYVSPVPAVRALIQEEWVPVGHAMRWLGAIGAASLLARDTGLPERSALYQILASDPAERIVRRIEEQPKKSLTLRHLQLIAQLPGFQTTPEAHP